MYHSCHSEEKCPPCTFLTQKWCMGKHEVSFLSQVFIVPTRDLWLDFVKRVSLIVSQNKYTPRSRDLLLPLFFLFFFFSLRYSLHKMKCTLLSVQVYEFWQKHSYSHVTTTTVKMWNIHSPADIPLGHFIVTLPFPPGPGNQWSVVCPCSFAFSEYHINGIIQ